MQRRFPQLHHVADAAALPGIRRHGLLSAKALCHLFEVPAAARPALLTRNRDDYTRLTHPKHGEAWLRRQSLRDAPLRSRLDPALNPGQWRRFINAHAFLCTSSTWAERLRAFERGREQVVLTWDTGDLLAAGVALWLSRYNNGTVLDRAPPHRRRLRSLADYVPAAAMPPRMAVKEVAARRCIPPGIPFTVA